jgi:hypothetical protein
MKKYTLYKGFKIIGEYKSILDAKNKSPKEDGVYNLKGLNYRDSWQIVNGEFYENEN